MFYAHCAFHLDHINLDPGFVMPMNAPFEGFQRIVAETRPDCERLKLKQIEKGLVWGFGVEKMDVPSDGACSEVLFEFQQNFCLNTLISVWP